MSDEGKAFTRTLAVTAIVFTALAALLFALMRTPLRVDSKLPEITAADVDRVFDENTDAFNRGMDALWRHHELFDDLMEREGRSSNCSIGGASWRLDEIRYGDYMTDEEWQAVLDMWALIEPYCIIYYAPLKDDGCRAWALRVLYSVSDGVIPSNGARTELSYVYTRCTEESHEGFRWTCPVLWRHVKYIAQRFDDWRVTDEAHWLRGTKVR